MKLVTNMKCCATCIHTFVTYPLFFAPANMRIEKYYVNRFSFSAVKYIIMVLHSSSPDYQAFFVQVPIDAHICIVFFVFLHVFYQNLNLFTRTVKYKQTSPMTKRFNITAVAPLNTKHGLHYYYCIIASVLYPLRY